jgi:hypothetical protein
MHIPIFCSTHLARRFCIAEAEVKDFPWTSINLNCNYAAKRHRDQSLGMPWATGGNPVDPGLKGWVVLWMREGKFAKKDTHIIIQEESEHHVSGVYV